MNFTDILYFASALFMVSMLFFGIDENFAIVMAFIIFAVWLQIKSLAK
jgi:hypothetical protein